MELRTEIREHISIQKSSCSRIFLKAQILIEPRLCPLFYTGKKQTLDMREGQDFKTKR